MKKRLKRTIAFCAATILACSVSFTAESKGLKGLLKGLGNEIVNEGKSIGKSIVDDVTKSGKKKVDDALNNNSTKRQGNTSGSNNGLSSETVRILLGDCEPKTTGNTSAQTSKQATPKTNGSTATRKTANRASAGPSKQNATDDGKVISLLFNNITMNNPMFRQAEGGHLILDKQGMSLEGNISVNVKNHRGDRIVCLVSPIVNGNMLADSYGECTAIIAFTPNSESVQVNVPFALPYGWMGMNMNSKMNEPENLQVEVNVIDLKREAVLASALFDIGPQHIQLNQQDVPMNMLSSLFGGTADGDLTHTCAACDGTGLCSQCYGDAYLSPSNCRHCAGNPGICRRCKGLGEEGTNVSGGGGLFDFF